MIGQYAWEVCLFSGGKGEGVELGKREGWGRDWDKRLGKLKSGYNI